MVGRRLHKRANWRCASAAPDGGEAMDGDDLHCRRRRLDLFQITELHSGIGHVTWHGWTGRSVLPQGLSPALRDFSLSCGPSAFTSPKDPCTQSGTGMAVDRRARAHCIPSTQHAADIPPLLSVLEEVQPAFNRRRLEWMPSPGWAVAIGTVAFISIISITRFSEFLIGNFKSFSCYIGVAARLSDDSSIDDRRAGALHGAADGIG